MKNPGKCSVPGCLRDQYSPRFYYCKAHYNRHKRGKPMEQPIRNRGLGVRATAIHQCAALAQLHGQIELAELMRKL